MKSYETKVPDDWEEAIRKAELNYKMFASREPDSAFIVQEFQWPTIQSHMGRGRRIGYWSDKIMPDNPNGDWIKYSHPFKSPKPWVIRQYVPGDRVCKNPVFTPYEPVITWLGYALDLELRTVKNKIRTLDWVSYYSHANLPLLGWLPEKRCLVIQAQILNEPPLLVTSPILKVTSRGIEN